MQDEKLVGVAVRLTLAVLAFARRTTPEALGLQAKESRTPPLPAVDTKCMVRGLVAQLALGFVLAENPTTAYAPIITRLMVTPTMRCGRYCLTGDDNCEPRVHPEDLRFLVGLRRAPAVLAASDTTISLRGLGIFDRAMRFNLAKPASINFCNMGPQEFT